MVGPCMLFVSLILLAPWLLVAKEIGAAIGKKPVILFLLGLLYGLLPAVLYVGSFYIPIWIGEIPGEAPESLALIFCVAGVVGICVTWYLFYAGATTGGV